MTDPDAVNRPFRKEASARAIATEVHSLRWLADATPPGGAAVAELLGSGTSWLETRRLDHGAPDHADAWAFGRALARTHAAGAKWFGVAPPGLTAEDAVLAELPSPSLSTAQYSSWGAFFAELRLLPYVVMARDRGALGSKEVHRLSRFIDAVADGRFDAPQPGAVRAAHAASGESANPPVARNHGDLWGGNVVWATTEDGTVGTLIDPSSHGGHAETDLAELALFGSPHLADTVLGYREVSPLADGWEERIPLHQLHMLLVHVVLFGGSYVPQALAVTDTLR